MKCWWTNPNYDNELVPQYFNNMEKVLGLQGIQITRSPHGRLLKINISNRNFFVKIYTSAGKYLRRFLGRSRNRAEYENLLLFQGLNIKTPTIIAFGEEKKFNYFQNGVLVTEELPNVLDLAVIAKKKLNFFSQKKWRKKIIETIAVYARTLHAVGFVHNDLKWRNILVSLSDDPDVYLIDCPSGQHKWGWLKSRGVIKDLACLDKLAKVHLSHAERLRFYCHYHNIRRLNAAHRRQIRKIINFFNGRE